jgi:hypothetical protein
VAQLIVLVTNASLEQQIVYPMRNREKREDLVTCSNYYEIYYMMIELEEHRNQVRVKKIFELLLHSKSIKKKTYFLIEIKEFSFYRKTFQQLHVRTEIIFNTK